MMQRLLNSIRYGWNAARIIRLALGLLIFIQALFAHDNMLAVMGTWLLIMPLFNVSCCGVGGCDTDQASSKHGSQHKDVSQTKFEEIK